MNKQEKEGGKVLRHSGKFGNNKTKNSYIPSLKVKF